MYRTDNNKMKNKSGELGNNRLGKKIKKQQGTRQRGNN